MNEERPNGSPVQAEVTTVSPPSHLFTVRIWPDVSEQGLVNWRGKVQAVPNGAWRYFHNWDTLTTFLQTQVEALAGEPQPPSLPPLAGSLGC